MSQPFQLHVKPYRGHKPERRAQWQGELAAANRIAAHINAKLADLPEESVIEIDYYEIATDCGLEKAVVKRILFANGGGSNGITIRK